MPLTNKLAQIFLGLLLVICCTGSAICDEHDDLMEIGNELKLAIEQRSNSTLLKYIHGRMCFDDDCYEKSELKMLLKDKNSWPSKNLFFGNQSARTIIMNAAKLATEVHKDKSNNRLYRIVFTDSGSKDMSTVIIFMHKDGSQWTITGLDYH